jgi:general secretion pathway protein K
MRSTPTCREPRVGSALLAVLWLVAALSAMAFSLAATVRSEVGRASAAVDNLKAYYLATGAVERALLFIEWGPRYRKPDRSSRYYNGGPHLQFGFPGGQASVDIIPEAAKMDVNTARPEELNQLLLALGADPARAQEIASGIVNWRSPQPPGAPDLSDQFSSPASPSFRARHASFQEIEEVLLVRGMTPELFYGTYERDAQGRLKAKPGLKDCLTVYGSGGQFDINTAPEPVLAAIGLPGPLAASIVATRRLHPFTKPEELQALRTNVPGAARLRIGGNTIYTIRATARPRLPNGQLSDARRSVAVEVKWLDPAKYVQPYQVLRWYDNAWVE